MLFILSPRSSGLGIANGFQVELLAVGAELKAEPNFPVGERRRPAKVEPPSELDKAALPGADGRVEPALDSRLATALFGVPAVAAGASHSSR